MYREYYTKTATHKNILLSFSQYIYSYIYIIRTHYRHNAIWSESYIKPKRVGIYKVCAMWSKTISFQIVTSISPRLPHTLEANTPHLCCVSVKVVPAAFDVYICVHCLGAQMCLFHCRLSVMPSFGMFWSVFDVI